MKTSSSTRLFLTEVSATFTLHFGALFFSNFNSIGGHTATNLLTQGTRLLFLVLSKTNLQGILGVISRISMMCVGNDAAQ